MRAACALVFVLVGCGRIGFDALVDAAPAPRCDRLAITDNFDDGTQDLAWTHVGSSSVTVAETGGMLEIDLPASMTTAVYGGYDSAAPFDFRDHCMYVTVAETPAVAQGAELFFDVNVADRGTGLDVTNGNLYAFENLSGTFVSLRYVPYEPTVHRVFQLRESAGTMFWETSADGRNFDLLYTAPDPRDVSAVTLTLRAGTYMSIASPGRARFDDFDLP